MFLFNYTSLEVLCSVILIAALSSIEQSAII